MLVTIRVAGTKMTQLSSQNRRHLPSGIFFVALSLLLYGIVGMIGCFLLPRGGEFFYFLLRSIVFVITAILVLIDNRSALKFAFLSAAFLTIDAALQFSLFDNLRFSISSVAQILRFVISSTFSWVAYYWYKKWSTN
jgi:hypothetical protein